ncbi:MAG: DUF3293 domain-containing protein [Pseudomonadales bacterium]
MQRLRHACNPRGEMGTDGENHARQQALAVNLDQKGHARLTGIGEDPAGEWPGEASLLILGMNREEAADLGAQWGQNAVVWAGADATPELIFLR